MIIPRSVFKLLRRFKFIFATGIQLKHVRLFFTKKKKRILHLHTRQ